MKRCATRLAATLRLWVVALFAVAQVLPSGVALAADSDGLSVVICTGDGLQTLSWEELTGEPSPYQEHEQESGGQPCHACYTSCRIGAAVTNDSQLASSPPVVYTQAAKAPVVEAIKPSTTRPPMPSRSPPQQDV